MPYITVRNKPNLTTTHQQNLFKRTMTYIDYQGKHSPRPVLDLDTSTLGQELRHKLQASAVYYDESRDPSISRDTCTYSTEKPPHVLFNVLERLGYKVVAAITIDQTAVWTLHKKG